MTFRARDGKKCDFARHKFEIKNTPQGGGFNQLSIADTC